MKTSTATPIWLRLDDLLAEDAVARAWTARAVFERKIKITSVGMQAPDFPSLQVSSLAEAFSIVSQAGVAMVENIRRGATAKHEVTHELYFDRDMNHGCLVWAWGTVGLDVCFFISIAPG